MAMDAFKTACRALTRFPVDSDANPEDSTVLSCYPLVGLLAGLGLWLVAWALQALAEKAVASMVGAICIPLLLWWVTCAEGLQGLTWAVDRRFSMMAKVPNEEHHRHMFYLAVTTFQALVLLKLLCTGWLLYAGKGAWFTVVPVLSFSALAEMRQAEKPRRAVEGDRLRFAHWLLAVAVVVIVARLMGQLAMGAIAVMGVWVLVPVLRSITGPGFDQLPEQAKRAAAELAELAVLALAVLYGSGS
jgi:cobalamin synthase